VAYDRVKYLPTIKRVSDELWDEIRLILPSEKPNNTIGRPAVSFRKVLDGILYVLRTGCQWKMLPKEFGSGSTCHRRFQQWSISKVFQRLWSRLLKVYDGIVGIQWKWQSLDSISVKAPLGKEMTGPNPTDRDKLGTKRHVLTDGQGIPLAVVITAANTHDMKAAMHTLNNIVVKRPFSKIYRKKQIFIWIKGMTFRRLRIVLSTKDINHIFDIEENNQ
jgi:putative transposase